MNYKRILAVALTAFAGMFLYCGDNVIQAPDDGTTGNNSGGGGGSSTAVSISADVVRDEASNSVSITVSSSKAGNLSYAFLATDAQTPAGEALANNGTKISVTKGATELSPITLPGSFENRDVKVVLVVKAGTQISNVETKIKYTFAQGVAVTASGSSGNFVLSNPQAYLPKSTAQKAADFKAKYETFSAALIDLKAFTNGKPLILTLGSAAALNLGSETGSFANSTTATDPTWGPIQFKGKSTSSSASTISLAAGVVAEFSNASVTNTGTGNAITVAAGASVTVSGNSVIKAATGDPIGGAGAASVVIDGNNVVLLKGDKEVDKKGDEINKEPTKADAAVLTPISITGVTSNSVKISFSTNKPAVAYYYAVFDETDLEPKIDGFLETLYEIFEDNAAKKVEKTLTLDVASAGKYLYVIAEGDWEPAYSEAIELGQIVFGAASNEDKVEIALDEINAYTLANHSGAFDDEEAAVAYAKSVIDELPSVKGLVATDIDVTNFTNATDGIDGTAPEKAGTAGSLVFKVDVVAGKESGKSLSKTLKILPIAFVSDADKVAATVAEVTWDAIKLTNTAENSVTSDLNLPGTGTIYNTVTIVWSVDPATSAAINLTTGAVTRPAQGSADETVKLTATITSGTEEDEVDFNLTVKAEAAVVDDAGKVAATVAEVTWAAIAGTNSAATNVTANLTTLPLLGTTHADVTIAWESNKPAVVSAAGIVTRPAQGDPDETVKLTATITSGAEEDEVEFTLTVMAEAAAVTDADKVAATKAEVTWAAIAGTNSAATDVTANLATLPFLGTTHADVTIAWESDKPAVVSAAGVVTRPAQGSQDETVKLTATITSGEEEDEVEFTLTVKAEAAAVTDADKVAATKAEVTWAAIAGTNSAATDVTANLATLPFLGTTHADVTIAWESDKPAVVSAAGVVTRPAQGSQDETVKLTATITSGEEEDEVEFTLTVKAED